MRLNNLQLYVQVLTQGKFMQIKVIIIKITKSQIQKENY